MRKAEYCFDPAKSLFQKNKNKNKKNNNNPEGTPPLRGVPYPTL
jgi:hypothetical protein